MSSSPKAWQSGKGLAGRQEVIGPHPLTARKYFANPRKLGIVADQIRLGGRPAFTLVEMLVVVSILLIITVAVVVVAPRFTDDRKMSRAADQLAQILLTAKQRAKRDQIPTGVRFFPDPQHNNLITQAQYIQQPDDFAPAGSMVTLTAVANSAAIVSNLPAGTLWPPASWPGSVLVAQGVLAPGAPPGTPPPDFTGGFADSSLWPVQPGDYLSVKGNAHLILAVFPLVVGPPVVPSTLVLAPVAPFQPASSIDPASSGTMTIRFMATANTAQIASGMIITGPWANPMGTTTSIRSVNNTVPPSNTPPQQSLTLSTTAGPGGDWIGFLPPVSGQPTSYNIIRAPRVLQGETPLQLPAGICIDPTVKIIDPVTKQSLDPYAFSAPADIMFTPQGSVLNSAGRDVIILWARDYTKDVSYPVTSWPPGGQPGDQFLILIQTHTGFIAEHPVDVGSADPYSFTKDARSSGL